MMVMTQKANVNSLNDKFAKYNIKELSGRDARLLREWMDIDDFCERNKHIAYIIRRRCNDTLELPIEYEIHYKVTSIVGVEDTEAPRKPLFADLHIMQIYLPNNYPSATGNPEFQFLPTPKDGHIPWHPNIRYSGSFKGRVCLNIKEMGVMASLKVLIKRVEQYLRYQLYHAKNTHPYPEDQNVADWVCEEAEPNDWLRFDEQTRNFLEQTDKPSKPETDTGTHAPTRRRRTI